MAMQSIEQLKARVEARRHELLTDDRDPTRFFILDAGNATATATIQHVRSWNASRSMKHVSL
jgi:hypothetical protein